jgi:hypothetical protein
MISLKEKMDRLYLNPSFQKAMDLCRILTLLLLLVLLGYIVYNIEIVKLFNSNVCEICTYKTKAICMHFQS